jgi:hypothetical protein
MSSAKSAAAWMLSYNLHWIGLSALNLFCGFFPRALPWADMVRALGALTAFALCL